MVALASLGLAFVALLAYRHPETAWHTGKVSDNSIEQRKRWLAVYLQQEQPRRIVRFRRGKCDCKRHRARIVVVSNQHDIPCELPTGIEKE